MKNQIKIIAEIGINHNGSNETARNLIKASKEAGVDAVKFQYRNLDNSYSSAKREIGDELLLEEIHRTYLAPAIILNLSKYAQNIGLEAGISFFDVVDMDDFGDRIHQFDFMKVPSAELTNIALVRAMIKLKHAYISTGCHSENEIEKVFNSLPLDGWTPMHCISNYPVAIQNAKLGYIGFLKEKWRRDIGYSSHDDSWETCILAMQIGATVIERHITFDRQAEGLDHSTSSTPAEFEKLCNFSKHFEQIVSGNSSRVANQGELLNLQNLGRSYYSDIAMEEGSTLKLSDLVYRAPRTGIGKLDIDKYIGKKIVRSISSGTVVSPSLITRSEKLSDEAIQFALDQNLSLPVRLHDLGQIQTMFPIGAFEFHLSHEEIRSEIDLQTIDSNNKYSVHLPDYVSSTLLMDPFSPSNKQNQESMYILERTIEFASRLSQLTGRVIPVVGSFSVVNETISKFYSRHAELLNSLESEGIELLMQWLPPQAWYFGGSIQLEVLNDEKDIPYLQQNNISICMDVCHLLMGQCYFKFDAEKLMSQLTDCTKHIHLADSIGFDGEGIAFGEGDPENMRVIEEVLQFNCLKVIEVWQGHLDNGAGFSKALTSLSKLSIN